MRKTYVLVCAFLLCVVAAMGQAGNNRIEIDRPFFSMSLNTIDIISSKRNIIVKKGEKGQLRIKLTFALNAQPSEPVDWLQVLRIKIDSSSAGHLELYAPGVAGISKQWLKGDWNAKGADPDILSDLRAAQRNPNDPSLKKRNELFRLIKDDMARIAITVFVPEEVNVNIYNAYSDVMVEPSFKSGIVVLKNSNFRAAHVDSLQLTADLSTVTVGNVQRAEIRSANGTFSAGKIGYLVLHSNTSSIDYEGGVYGLFESEGDRITVGSLATADVVKAFGFIHINQLGEQLKLKGKNADLRINSLSNAVKLIQVENSAARVQLPAKGADSYTVQFQGEGSTVLAPFERQELDEKGNAIDRTSPSLTPKRFSAQVGSKPSTKIDFKCDNCSIIFN